MGDNTKSKKGRVVILVCNTSSGLVLHFFQVPSKYSKGYGSYRVDTKSLSNKTKGDNYKSKKGRVVILVRDLSSGPALHFYQVSSEYSKGYSNYRADKKFYANRIHPKTIGFLTNHGLNNFGRASPKEHFCQILLKWSSGF